VAMPTDWAHGFLQVEDTLEALQQLASHVRSRFKGPVVGITGGRFFFPILCMLLGLRRLPFFSSLERTLIYS
jgi:hypothetical protein